MKPKIRWGFLFFVLILGFLFFFLRDILLLSLTKEVLKRSGLNFSCKSLSLRGGRFELLDLELKDPTMAIRAKRGEISFSWRERGLRISLRDFEGRYFPSSTPLSPPRYLAGLSLRDGKILVAGKRPFSVHLKKFDLSGLKDLWEGLRLKKALAFEEGPHPPATSPSSPPLELLSKEAAARIKSEIDFSRLPDDLKEKIPLKRGLLEINIVLRPKAEKILPYGRAKLKEGLFWVQGKGLPLEGETHFSGWWQNKGGNFFLEGKAVLNLPFIFSYKVKGRFQEGSFDLSSLSLNFKGPLTGLSQFVGAKFKGQLSGSGAIFPKARSFSFNFSLQRGGFEITAERVGENIELEGEIEGHYQKKLSFSGSFRLFKGEIFWAPWYYALKRTLKLSFEGSYGKDHFFFKRLKLEGPFKAEVESLSLLPLNLPEKSKLSLKIEDFWFPLVAEPFGEEHPFLTEILPRGDLSFSQQNDSFYGIFKGELSFKDHKISKIFLKGAYSPLGKCEDLLLSWGEIVGPFVEGGPLELKGKVCGPYLDIGPFGFQLLKGDISAGGGEGNLKGAFLTLKEIILRDLRPNLSGPWKALSPRISGKFERLVFEKGKIQSRGELKIFLAEGWLSLRDPFFEAGILPRYGGEVEFSGLDLALLSRVSGLGLITGRLRGRIKDLVMVGKLPESFELWLEDDPDYRGPKRISLKAVRQISELGGGSASLFVPFVKTLRYQRLGIYCRLKGDVFYLRGLIKRGGREYLLKGPKLLGVDVINQNPKGAISFKEMVRRLKHILEVEHEKESST